MASTALETRHAAIQKKYSWAQVNMLVRAQGARGMTFFEMVLLRCLPHFSAITKTRVAIWPARAWQFFLAVATFTGFSTAFSLGDDWDDQRSPRKPRGHDKVIKFRGCFCEVEKPLGDPVGRSRRKQ